jgi:CrcB protein
MVADGWPRFLLAVDVLGGFTTFSSFSLDAVLVIQRGVWVQAVLYITGSVLVSLIGLTIGLRLGR